MRKAVLAGLLAPIVLFALVKFIPYLGGSIPSIESTPAVQPLRQPTAVRVGPGERLCVNGLVLGPESRFVQFTPEDRRPSRPPLEITASSRDGYRTSTAVPPVSNATGPITASITPPTTERDNARVCLLNQGKAKIFLFGVDPGFDSTISTTTVNAKPIPQDVSLTVLRATSVSRVSNLPAMLDRAADFVPFGPWALWILAALLVFGVPAAAAAALMKSCSGSGG